MRWLDSITDSMDINVAEQTLGNNEGWRSLVYCSPCGRRVRDYLATEEQRTDKTDRQIDRQIN